MKYLFLAAALLGCGDNLKPPSTDQPAGVVASATASVGGGTVAHSKSFMLVTRVATSDAHIAKGGSVTLKPGVGGQ